MSRATNTNISASLTSLQLQADNVGLGENKSGGPGKKSSTKKSQKTELEKSRSRKRSRKNASNNTTKTASSDTSLLFDYTSTRIQGNREYQEDHYVVCRFSEHLFLFAVFDGHGGSACSSFLEKEFPRTVRDILNTRKTSNPRLDVVLKSAVDHVVKAWDDLSLGVGEREKIVDDATKQDFFARLDADAFSAEEKDSGSTLTAVLYNSQQRRLFMANLGDSRSAVLCQKKLHATFDHGVKSKLDDTGGFTGYVKDNRLCEDLAMARSVGDNTEQLLGVVGRECDIVRVDVPDKACATVIVASDGMWDVFNTQEAFLNPRLHAQDFVNEKGGETTFDDNTTILLVNIKPKP
jgi:serine/threonine protein phosphatase PrpC